MTRLPIPENFPIKWKNSEDEDKLWLPEAMHAPFPLTPASEYTGGDIVSAGLIRAFDIHGIPINFELQVFNYYQYVTVTSKKIPPEKMDETIQIAEENCELSITSISEDWQNKWRPEVIALNEKIESVPFHTFTDAELATHFENVLSWAKRLWEIHGELGVPMLLAPSIFQEVYTDLFSPEDKLEAVGLLEGQDSETVETGIKMWQLSKDIQSHPIVAKIFLNNKASEVLENCRQTKEGRDFLKKIDDFLAEYGKRNENFLELNSPTWIEDPTPLITLIRTYLQNPEMDLEVIHQKKKETHEKNVAKVRNKLQSFPKAIQENFEILLAAAQTAFRLQEDHAYIIDARVVSVTRKVLTEINKRLVSAGLALLEEDIYYLYAPEIITTLRTRENLQEKINQRKAEFKHFTNIERPSAFGTESKVEMPDTIFNRALGRFFGGSPELSMDKNVLYGNAASSGKVIGRVVVANHVKDALALKPGEILVTRTTSPSWTPLFATAGGVVTETGGTLCHCAIVAREYNIPAVVGVQGACSLLNTNMKIEVDGDKGKILILPDEENPSV